MAEFGFIQSPLSSSISEEFSRCLSRNQVRLEIVKVLDHIDASEPVGFVEPRYAC